MREILFRGRRLEKGTLGIDQFSKKGDWIEGGVYFDDDGDCYIILGVDDCGMLYINVKVDPSTLCQFTGLRDKNGKRIWEGDILAPIREARDQGKFVVKWKHREAKWTCNTGSGVFISTFNWEYRTRLGSIHDEEQL